MSGAPHLPYGAAAPAPATAPLPAGWRLCPCGERVRPWFKGRGVGHGIWIGVVSPLITLALYAFVVAVGLTAEVAARPVAQAIVLGLIPFSYLVVLVVLVRAKHRGGCLIARSLAWFIVWPGATVTAIMSALA